MLFLVLKEDYKIKFREYGEIEIPKGTAVDKTEYENPDMQNCPVCEFGWIKEKYPAQSDKMKADAIEHGILIPKEKLIKALRACFLHGDSGYCRDIYKAINRKYKYCRMEGRIKDKVEWLTVTPDWEEPNCPLRCDILIQITDKEGKVIITEQLEKTIDESVSDKRFPFSWEKPATTDEQQLMSLIYNL